MAVEWALSGEQAVEMAQQRRRQGRDYQIVLLDWKMPGLDGIQTARKLRETIGDHIPILLISAYDWSDIEDQAREAGISGFISKPLFKSTLYHGLLRFTDAEAVPQEEPQETMGDLPGSTSCWPRTTSSTGRSPRNCSPPAALPWIGRKTGRSVWKNSRQRPKGPTTSSSWTCACR